MFVVVGKGPRSAPELNRIFCGYYIFSLFALIKTKM